MLLTYGIPAAACAASALLFGGYNDVRMALIGAPYLVYERSRERSMCSSTAAVE